jgi:hypothetical protein
MRSFAVGDFADELVAGGETLLSVEGVGRMTFSKYSVRVLTGKGESMPPWIPLKAVPVTCVERGWGAPPLNM